MEKLWYRKPAKEWEEALPLGNGRLGAWWRAHRMESCVDH